MANKILIVDDEPEVVELVKDRLETQGYEVLTASDGKEGLARARDEKPDLILMDIMMPSMGGGQAVRLLKADYSTKEIPVVFLTAIVSKQEETNDQLRINVEDTYYPAIAKPFDSQKLLDMVSKHIKGDS